MAALAALLPSLALALAQQPGGAPFECGLPEGYAPFAAVPDQEQAWEASSSASRFLVRRFQLESAGARAGAVLRRLREQAWGPAALAVSEIAFEDWSGGWGGVPETAGHTVRYVLDGRRMAVVERVAVLRDTLVHFLWDGPETRLAEALAVAASFRVPDAWIPPPPPDRDPHRGVAPGSEARALPWRLEVRLDFLTHRESGELEVAVRAIAEPEQGSWDAPAWRLPPGAVDLGSDAAGFRRYLLRPSADAFQPFLAWGLRSSPQGDLAAFDAGWLAVPETPPGAWLPPGWSLEAHHPGHQGFVGPAAWTTATQLGEQGAVTRIGPVPAARCWPYFVSGRFQPRRVQDLTWRLRLDAKAIVPDEAAAALLALDRAADAWLGAPADGGWTLVSFPGAGDRVLAGLFVLDEDRDWFSQPADAALAGLPRRALLARLVAARRFGAQLRGSGHAAPVLEAALAEWAAARILDAAGFAADAAALRTFWESTEAAAGPLDRPLALLPASELHAAGRLLTAGARFWSALEARVGRAALDAALRGFAAAGAPWSTQDLERALAAAAPADAAALREFLDRHLYGMLRP